MKVLAVASEIYPLVKTGGLADVTGALPKALSREGVEVRTLIPGYPAVFDGLESAEQIDAYDELFGGPARLLHASAADLDLFVLDAPHLYLRQGNPYLDEQGRDLPDNAFRFAALARAAAAIGQGLLPAFMPDIVHAHDWQAGLTPAYLRSGPGAAAPCVMTVHNLAFQGLFPAELLRQLRLPAAMMNPEGIEYYGQIGFLKAGLQFANAITTVSPTYAEEIRTPENGMGLDGVLRARTSALSGICNGIDIDVWNPGSDPHLATRYEAGSLTAKADNKTALQVELGLSPAASRPLFGVISRLTEQKGMDIVLDAVADLVSRGVQLALLGSGDRGLEAAFAEEASRHRGAVAARIGYDEGLAHLIQGGSDALLVPSRFEPCGLTQLAALRYGTLPIVSRVGGLADTVIDANQAALAAGVATGFQFSPPAKEAFLRGVDRALDLWSAEETWHRLQRNAMRSDVGWSRSARLYAALFDAVSVTRPEASAAHAAIP
ncbi:MAG: glycogen synthase GlgA [Hyphomicrobiales bacterium]